MVLLGPAAAAGLALAGLLAIPASSPAVSATVTGSGDGTILTRTVKCPAGERATGGGFTTQSPTTYPSTPFVRVYESRKIEQSSWRVRGQITDPEATGQSRTLQAIAYCSDSAAATAARFTIRISSFGQFFWLAKAECPKGTDAKAGGFKGPPPNIGPRDPNEIVNHAVASSLLRGKTGHESTFGAVLPGVSFTSYVYCSTEGKISTRTGLKNSGGNNVPVTAVSEGCKKAGNKPAAGGFEQPFVSGQTGPGYYTNFWQSYRVGKKWSVSAIHKGPGFTTLFAFAYCSSDSSGTQRRVRRKGGRKQQRG